MSAPTIYSVFGGKSGIVVAMLEELEQNADRDVWVGKLMAQGDPHEQVLIFATWIRTLFEGGAPILKAAMAARSEPDVAELADRGDNARREGTRQLTALWASAGALRTGLDAEQAAQQLWLLTSVEQFLLATDTLAWSADEYETWLGEILTRQLLKPRA